MRKIKYILALLIGVVLYSCEPEYDLEIDQSDVRNLFLQVNNSSTSVVVSETKTFNLYLRSYTPIYEDVTINWSISGDGFTSFSGTGTYNASTGEKGTISDTIVVEIPASVVPDGELFVEGTLTYTCTTASGKEIDAGYNDTKKTLDVVVNKYIPLDRSNFIGTYNEFDGVDTYPGVVVEEDPDDEFGLIIHTLTWGAGGSYKAVFNTIAEEVDCPSQFIGLDYWAGVSSDDSGAGAIWFNPATDGSSGSFNTTTGAFTVPVEMALPNYPYSFGDVTLSYTK